MPPKNLSDGLSAGMIEPQVATTIGVSGNLDAHLVIMVLVLLQQLKAITQDIPHPSLVVPNMLASRRNIFYKVTSPIDSGLIKAQVALTTVPFGASKTLHSIGAGSTTIKPNLLTPSGE